MPVPRKRPEKLRCKPGYIQRGAACQPIRPTKARSSGGGLGKAIAGVAAVGAIGAGAALVVQRNGKNKADNPTILPNQDNSKSSRAFKRALVAGAVTVGVPLAAYKASVIRYRNNLDASAKEAMAEAEKVEVPDEVKSGLRLSELGIKDGGKNIELGKKAEQATFVVNGFGGTGGRAGDHFGLQFLKNHKTHHVVGVENPEFDTNLKKEGAVSSLEVQNFQKGARLMMKTVIKDGKNPVAIRMAAKAYAYHKKTGLPVNLIGYSAGGTVANEAAELLKRMGVKDDDLRVANMGSPYYGLVPLHKNTKHFISNKDPVSKQPGFKTSQDQQVETVKDHYSYLSNTQVKWALQSFFKREEKSKADSLVNKSPYYILGRTTLLAST